MDAHRRSSGALVAAATLVLAACGGATTAARPPTQPSQADHDRTLVAQFADTERGVRELLSAGDPRVAARTGLTPSESVLSRIRQEAIMAEDGTTALRGASLDLFSFSARMRAIAAAAAELVATGQALPVDAPSGSALARPRLERELVARMVEEERARTARESRLGDASAELVRGMVATWAPPGSPWEWQERDGWAARRLLEVRASFEHVTPRTAPSDLDAALYVLEKLLVPMQFPRATSALTQLHEALDADDRTSPTATSAADLASLAKTHLGVALPPEGLDGVRARLQATLDKVRVLLDAASGKDAAPSDDVVRDARRMMYEEAACAVTDGSPMRSAAPPAERAAICGAMRLVERGASTDPGRVAALTAMHDELLVAIRALAAQPRGAYIMGRATHGDDDFADRLVHLAGARPIIPLGVGLALEIVYRVPAEAPHLARAWLTLGDAPLDIVERELRGFASAPAAPTASTGPVATSSTSAPPPAPAAPRP